MAPNIEHQIPIILHTKQQLLSIPRVQLWVPETANSTYLNTIVNQFLDRPSAILESKNFDFLVADELLSIPLNDFLRQKHLSSPPVNVEYREKIQATPRLKPEDPCVRVVRVCRDHTILLWDRKRNISIFEPTAPQGYSNEVESFGRSPTCLDTSNNYFISTGQGQVMKFPQCTLDEDENTICPIVMGHSINTEIMLPKSWSPDHNRLIADSSNRIIRLYDPRTVSEATFNWQHHHHPDLSISGGYHSYVKLWDTRNTKTSVTTHLHPTQTFAVLDWSNPN